MNPISSGCRLCCDPLADCFTKIDNPQLKVQMEKVFCFPIEPKQGYRSGVCQSCSYTIFEFYQYSEKVRKNQEVLNENVTNCVPTVDSKISLAEVKVETCDSVPTETAEQAYEPLDEVSGGDIPNSSDDESYEHTPKKSQPRRKEGLRKVKLKKPKDSKANKPSTTSKQSTMKTKLKRDEEDELFNKHFPMTCDLCGTSETTFTELTRHFNKVHKRRDAYVICCNKKLFKRSSIREHIGFHANPDAFRCEVCGNKYKNKDYLNRHMLCQHSSAAADPLMCDICLQEYPHAHSLYTHKLVTHAEPKYECEFCGKKFKKAISLKEHQSSHTGEALYACEFCGVTKNRKATLRRHIKLKHPTECTTTVNAQMSDPS